MNLITDYTIIQRGPDGFGHGIFAGKLEGVGEGVVVCRVIREDDSLTVIPWKKCERNGSDWLIVLDIPQGGLYRLEARFSETEFSPNNNAYDWRELVGVASHVGVGDIFVMAGQSNMAGYGKDPAYDPPQLGVHLFDNTGNWVIASHPLNSVMHPVYRNNDGGSFTSPALSFGRMMSKRLGVPVGLVSACLGGSALRSWNPAEEDCFLYEDMVKKIEAVGKFAGMIWYQGCNETGDIRDAQAYLEKFTETVGLWRERFGFFPIVTCQLNRHAWKEDDKDREWGTVREAQRNAAKQIDGVYTVPTIDLHTSDGIHNASGANIIIGERMANVLLKGQYGLPGLDVPNIERIRAIDNKTVLITFEGDHMLRTMDDNACGLNIEDANGLAKCVSVSACDEGLKVVCEREFGENAVFHAYWQKEQPAFFVRDIYGTPILACFGTPIEQ